MDQLSPTEGAHELEWLPVTLPPNVKFIVSCAELPEHPDIKIVQKFCNLIDDDACYVNVAKMETSLGEKVVNSALIVKRRKVTDAQMDIVRDALIKCNLPLFVRLIGDRVLKWRSYTPTYLTTLPTTVNDCINE